MSSISVGSKRIGDSQPVFVIAEAGVNHNGSLDMARRLVDAAVDAQADAVKFQTFRADQLASPTAPKAEYQARLTGAGESQFDMLKSLELSEEDHRNIQHYCDARGIIFLSTPFDEFSARFLATLNMPAFKIGSGDVTNFPFLDLVSAFGKPIILSTGMSYLSEVDEALRVIRTRTREIVLLHCVSSYPACPEQTNLRAMQTLASAFRVPVGYSDHTRGIEIPLAATAMGACVIEKHLTLDNNLSGPDHQASLEPAEFRAMVAAIRKVEQALGDGAKIPVPAEMNTREVARRSLAASRDLPAGTRLDREMLIAIRPGTGLSPSQLNIVVNRTLKRSLARFDMLGLSDFE